MDENDDIGNRAGDELLACVDCSIAFTFTSGERSFYAERGLTAPKRCRPCRVARRGHAPAWTGNHAQIEWRDEMTEQRERAMSATGRTPGASDARSIAIAKGLIELGDLARRKNLQCEACNKGPANVTSYVRGKFLHRCSWCADEDRSVRRTVTPQRSPAATYTSAERARLARAERGEFIEAPAPARVPRASSAPPWGDSSGFRRPARPGHAKTNGASF